MADDHHGGQHRPVSDARAAPVTPDSRQRHSYETGESSASATGSNRDATPSTEQSNGASASDTVNHESSPAEAHAHSSEHLGRDSLRRRNRNRSAGGFLLQDAVAGGRDQGTRRRARSILQHRGKTPEKKSRPQQAENPDTHPSPAPPAPRITESPASPTTKASEGGRTPARRDRTTSDVDSSPASTNASSLDVDSTQIVNMALNLSESRRIASRRDVSRTNPPRLMPLEDSASRSNLRQHFQQQRKTSRTASPRPTSQTPSPRVASGARMSSPLQPAFDPSQGEQFRFRFSPSTLARAQKAKEHLELMSEYRRLLQGLPPLKPGHNRNPTSPPGSPMATPYDRQVALSRPYNPLQYIRNRKVRSRERKVIDGERQGFGDVEGVRAWVSQVFQWNSVDGINGSKTTFSMPHFPGADDPEGQPSPEPASKQALRIRRPRVDWFFDPCDMIADAYWLEQENHKQLIEDRFWRKVYPAPSGPSRPMSRQIDETAFDNSSFANKVAELEEFPGMADLRHTHTDELAQAGHRERAKQKLQDMRGFHHRHNSAHIDGIRTRRESLSDTSGSEVDLKAEIRRKTRPARRDTITSDANDLLQKQMMDIVAQEARDKELANVPETEALGQDDHVQSKVPTPEKVATTGAASRSHSRKTSVADFSDTETRFNASRSRLGSPQRQYHRGRPSLELPEYSRRGSVADVFQSIPSSPKNEDGKDSPFFAQPGISMSVASSRNGSPTRNPLSTLRRRLQDRTRDTGAESQSEEVEDDQRVLTSVPEPPSPSEKIVTRPTGDSYKSHRSTGSMRIRDDQAVGLRGLFKGPRIDTVIKGGVAKLGDIIWKRDGNEDTSSDSSSDESEDDSGRERSRPSLSLSRRESKRLQEEAKHAKHFYDAMPQFTHVGQSQSRPSMAQRQLIATEISRPPSRQSSKWNQLKPPRIDVRGASATSSPGLAPSRPGESDISDAESNQNSVPEGVKAADRRLNSVIEASILDQPGRSPSRQWSITDKSPFPEKTHLSKREIARMRALVLSSGIKAKEISRRGHEYCKPLCEESLELAKKDPRSNIGGVDWAEVAKLAPDLQELQTQQVASCEIYPLASRALGTAIQSSGQRWQSSADRFTSKTTPSLQKRIWEVRSRITDDLSQMTRRAADEADETNKELALDQPLKVKHVIDVVEKLLRKRRRRFRWVRRGLWLGVEWVLVGFMWYVWFVVMILRIFMGVGMGLLSGVWWLLWL